MLCSRARKRLNDCNWRHSEFCHYPELMDHLNDCAECSSLVHAEELLLNDISLVRKALPEGDLSLAAIREAAENTTKRRQKIVLGLLPNMRIRIAVAAVATAIVVLSLVPFNFTEKIGYEIAIGGVDRTVALDNQKITSLLGALGMEKDKASTLLGSLDKSEIRLSVGECSETCRLTISDLKTERDVSLMVKAIIDLGCCQIDNIAPIFRHESTSLLGLAARKLLS